MLHVLKPEEAVHGLKQQCRSYVHHGPATPGSRLVPCSIYRKVFWFWEVHVLFEDSFKIVHQLVFLYVSSLLLVLEEDRETKNLTVLFHKADFFVLRMLCVFRIKLQSCHEKQPSEPGSWLKGAKFLQIYETSESVFRWSFLRSNGSAFPGYGSHLGGSSTIQHWYLENCNNIMGDGRTITVSCGKGRHLLTLTLISDCCHFLHSSNGQ